MDFSSSSLNISTPIKLGPCQTKTSHNTFQIFNIINYCKNSKTETLVQSLDVHIAFGSLEISFLKMLIHCMSFGENLLRVISALYQIPAASLKINSLSSAYFHLCRGTNQGCPLSPFFSPLLLNLL